MSEIMIISGALLAVYLGYLIGGAWQPGMDIVSFIDGFLVVVNEPFENYFNGNTSKTILAAMCVYILIILLYYTSQRNLMPGKEYDTAKFASIKQVYQALKDKEESNNRILSQNVRMSFNTRYTRLNNNVLVIGESGAGKTFYVVKPNAMQLARYCFMIFTDPKGELVRAIGGFLKANG